MNMNYTYQGVPWSMPDPRVGYVPDFLNANDPRPAREQLHHNYAHGGGWQPFSGFAVTMPDGVDEPISIQYPGDPPYHEVSRARLRNEYIIVFEHSWVMILQQDGTHEIARMD